MSQYLSLSEMDPEVAPCLPGVKLPDFQALVPTHIPVVRQQWHAEGIPQTMNRFRPDLPPDSMYSVENHKVAVEGGEIDVRIVIPRPEDKHQQFPVLVWFHGGGWVMGNLDYDDLQLRILSVKFGITIVNVDYRLAPEHQFPTGIDDCYAALKWTVVHAAEIRGSLGNGFLVGGGCAGANLTAAIVHRARDDPSLSDHKITGHILQIPVLVHPSAYPAEYVGELQSYEQYKDAPILSAAAMNLFYECLNGPAEHPDLSPLLADHNNLPAVYIQVCGMDPLRDEGLLYERLLRERGIATKLDIYSDLPHGFHEFLPQLTAIKKWHADFHAGIEWLLKSTV
ncbi:Alpha/Beta hydrolase protein [Mycena capillaripes]|nr:Alpha/Beta hydrolase protein [Mycena capillaripes]